MAATKNTTKPRKGQPKEARRATPPPKQTPKSELPSEATSDMPPFKVIVTSAKKSDSRKRKRTEDSYSEVEFQPHAIEPELGTNWMIKPGSRWKAMKRYQKFIVADIPLDVGAIVYVHNGEFDGPHGTGVFDTSKQWVAQVLEVRAEDEHHVYLRVFWLYRHVDLPLNLQKSASYHGEHELIISNDMEIIDAMTVNGKVNDLKRFNDYLDDPDDDNDWYSDLIWRQTYDIRTKRLSKLRKYCICDQPANPDKILVRCSNEECGKWCHAKCIEDDTIQRLTTVQSLHNTSDDKLELDTESNTNLKTDTDAKTDTQAESNGDGKSGKVSGMISGSLKALTARLKTPTKTTTGIKKDAMHPENSTDLDELSVFEATVLKKQHDKQRQSRCMVKITKRTSDATEETEWEDDIECLFCRKRID